MQDQNLSFNQAAPGSFRLSSRCLANLDWTCCSRDTENTNIHFAAYQLLLWQISSDLYFLQGSLNLNVEQSWILENQYFDLWIYKQRSFMFCIRVLEKYIATRFYIFLTRINRYVKE